jgi:hypothetical protein
LKVAGFIQAEGADDVPSEADQAGAINDYCARKGWELVRVFRSPPQADADEGIALARSGSVDAVIGAVQGALWPDVAQSRKILK